MLMTRSTPRITYRIGMRAAVDAFEDKSVPLRGIASAVVEVAAFIQSYLENSNG
jgi:hypothetical protein